MIIYFYFIVLSLFTIGGIMFYISQRKKPDIEKKKSIIKFTGYFLIVNIVIISIIFTSYLFKIVAIAIVSFGLFELIRIVYIKKSFMKGALIILFYLLISCFFLLFSKIEPAIILITYLVISMFDAFSQVFGQWLGKHKIFPYVSPNKTWEGFMGGLIMTILLSITFTPFFPFKVLKIISLAFIISIFAFMGDVLESYSKRQLQIKDYSNLLPGQGGFLDRFDSFIFSGALIYLLKYCHLI